jgi:cation transporter-like permease
MSEQDHGESPIDSQLAAPPTSYESTPHVDLGEPSAGSATEMVQSRAAVLAILFLVTGALGIPLLWMNQSFSNLERILWSIIITIYTVALIVIAWMIVMWSYRQIFGY